jgi:hypothetical protein
MTATLILTLAAFWAMLLGGLYGLSHELRRQWRADEYLGIPRVIKSMHIVLMFVALVAVVLGLMMSYTIYKTLT